MYVPVSRKLIRSLDANFIEDKRLKDNDSEESLVSRVSSNMVDLDLVPSTPRPEIERVEVTNHPDAVHVDDHAQD